MEHYLRTIAAWAFALASFPALGADGVAFVADLKGEVTVDGVPRPVLMSELGKGQKVVLARDARIAVMYIQSGKEYVLRGPGSFAVGEREITASNGMPPAMRETAWRASGDVIVRVAQASSASVRMRSYAPQAPDGRPRLDYPTQGSVPTLQPTLRWIAPDNTPGELALAVAGREDRPVAKAKVTGNAYRLTTKLQPDTEYAWSLSLAGRDVGTARFRTLPAGAIQTLDKRRPAEKSEFTDRLMYALLLQELGATQDAQEAWGRLAKEREDLPELGGLAR